MLIIGLAFTGLGAAAARPREVEILTGTIPPYTYLEGEKPAGVAVELVQELAKLVGHSGKIRFLPWKRAVTMAEKAEPDAFLVIPLNRSPEREPLFSWLTQLLTDETVLVTKKGKKPRVTLHTDALNYVVGVLMGSPLETELRNKGFKKVDTGVDEETNAKKLSHGRIDAWFVAAMVAPFVYERGGFDATELEYGATLQTNDLHLGASKSFPEAEGAKWRAAMETIRANGIYEAIIAKYRRK